jgi:inner membrane protein
MSLPWWMWAIAAALIGLAELHATGSYLIWIAIGAALTAVVEAGWGLSISAQVGAFALFSAISCGGGYFIYRSLNHLKEPSPRNQRNLQLVGAQGVVCVDIVNGEGKVRLGDSVWLAAGPDLPEGTSVTVKSVQGTRIVVDPAELHPALTGPRP